MKIIFLTKKKKAKYMETIEKLNQLAIENLRFSLFDEGLDLLAGICGTEGLCYALQKTDARLKEAEEAYSQPDNRLDRRRYMGVYTRI